MERTVINQDFRLFFESSPGLYLLLSTDLTILAATDAYLEATLTDREQIVGRYLFDIFPDNPEDKETNAVDNMQASIDRVLKNKAPDTWADQRHDVRRPPSGGGGYETRFWRPTNYPIFDSKGEIKYILHSVENITEFVNLKEKGSEELAKYSHHLEKVNKKLIRANKQLTSQYEELIKKDARIDRLTYNNEVHEEINKQLSLVNAELAIAKEKAEESDRLKSAFLANISHEIRTPMNGILGFAEILKEHDLTSAKRQKYIDIIEKSGKRLLDTVQDLIDISKIETGQVVLHISETNLNKTLKNLYDFFKPQAEQKKLKFILRNHLPPDLSIINTDRAKLNSILTNLIKNAINYTDSGKIEIGCIGRNNFIEYYVSDTGIGISRSKHAVIFNRFEQADIYDTKAIQGSGLGLSIAKAYVEMLGGKIRLESEEGLGSTFYFTVPLNSGETKKIMQQKQESTPKEGIPQLKDKKILITEDDEFSMEMMVYMLEKTNCELLTTRDGLNAVEIFQKEHVDLVLLDIRLPGMNGYEVLRQIRSIDPGVPVIAQTAYATLDVVQKIKEAGFTNYILKPASPKQLYSLITKHLTLPDYG